MLEFDFKNINTKPIKDKLTTIDYSSFSEPYNDKIKQCIEQLLIKIEPR